VEKCSISASLVTNLVKNIYCFLFSYLKVGRSVGAIFILVHVFKIRKEYKK